MNDRTNERTNERMNAISYVYSNAVSLEISISAIVIRTNIFFYLYLEYAGVRCVSTDVCLCLDSYYGRPHFCYAYAFVVSALTTVMLMLALALMAIVVQTRVYTLLCFYTARRWYIKLAGLVKSNGTLIRLRLATEIES